MPKTANPWQQIRWLSDEIFLVGKVAFDLVTWGSPKKQSTAERFVLVKDKPFAESMSRILEGVSVRKFLEFGLYHGGSLVLFDRLYQLETGVGIDDRSAMPALHSYVDRHNVQDRLFPYLETNQADFAEVTTILDRHFAQCDVDVIIDDASHLYENNRRSFEASFPYLRPGGVYIIEDWGWAHWPGEFQTQNLFDGTPLSKLAMEIMLIQATHPDWIDHIYIDFHHVAIYKGPGFCFMPGQDRLSVRESYLSKRDISISRQPRE